MNKEREQYEISRRHLANMMAADPEEFTQEHVDSALNYLMPCGLLKHNRKDIPVKPLLVPPELVFPAQKDVQFDNDGRPFHHLYFTMTPNFYEAMYQMAEKEEELNKYEDWRLYQRITEPDSQL